MSQERSFRLSLFIIRVVAQGRAKVTERNTHRTTYCVILNDSSTQIQLILYSCRVHSGLRKVHSLSIKAQMVSLTVFWNSD
jgi:hypothetical protein